MRSRKWALALLAAAALGAAIALRPVRQPTIEGLWKPADPPRSPR